MLLPRALLLSILSMLAACDRAASGSVADSGPPAGPGAPVAEETAAVPPSGGASVHPLLDDPSPDTALWELVAGLKEDRDAPRHPADGGGRAWIEDPTPVVAGSYGRWTVIFEAGELGVAEGGVVTWQSSPFWRWSPAWIDPDGQMPEDVRRGKPGFTRLSTEAAGIRLEPRAYSDGLLVVTIAGRALAAGERIRFEYGAGEVMARADDFAELSKPFLIAVDGDGDGVRALLAEQPELRVLPSEAARLVATVTSVGAPGEPVRLTLAVLDAMGNSGVHFTGDLLLSGLPEEAGLPGRVSLPDDAGGLLTLSFHCPREGVYRIRAEGAGDLLSLSNPLVVQADAEHILWGDLHGHSRVSDGTGTPQAYFRYARDVAALDVVALTDHDHWGFRFLDADPQTWAAIQEQVRAFHEPGRFVTLLGYEWTNWIHGHRHVLSFEEQPQLPVLSSLDERYETPRQLWDALRGRKVLTFAHHPAGGPIATNWSFAPDPELEPVTEVVSVHGSSEGPDGPGLIYHARQGHFVRDALDRGYRLGFVGSGDSHDGHPGLAQLSNPSGLGGLVALLTGDCTRQGVLDALRQRRCYATSGARMVLRASLGGARMGSDVPPGDDSRSLVLMVRGTAPLAAVDVIRSGSVVDRQELGGESFDVISTWSLDHLEDGEYAYLRVIQTDGQMGYTSPFYVRAD